MFLPNSLTKVFIAPGPTDMRKSINGLSLLVVDQFDLDPLSGAVFVFCNRRRDIIKLLYWDRNGFCLFHKRLEKDRFQWPETTDEVLLINSSELLWLLDGCALDHWQGHHTLHYEEIA